MTQTRSRPPAGFWRLVRLLGGLGTGLAALLTLGTWGLTLTLLPVLSTWLSQAEAGLSTVNTNLTQLMASLEPLDILARPETLAAVRSVGDLADRAQEAPLIGAFLTQNGVTEQALREFQTVTDNWVTLLESRPSVPELRSQQAEVQTWLQRTQTAQRWLSPAAWLLNLGALLLGAWFLAGQWALMRLAGERLAALRAQGEPG
ncbi:hypothetical protein [Deinococcus piscis]|nr:hypothetical protein [Deinococcus piscis]